MKKNPDAVKIDGQTRKNLGVSINDIIEVQKVDTKIAKSVVLMPVTDVVTVDQEFTDFVKNRLKGLPITDGDEISVMILGNSMEFRISKVSPKRIVRIDRSTNLKILSEAVSDKKIRITYEEVGGLVSEIKIYARNCRASTETP